MKQKGTKNLTLTQRIQLETLLNEGVHKTVIAERLGVCLATVYNEIKRGYYQRKKIKYRNWFGDKTYKYVDSYSANIAHDKRRMLVSASVASRLVYVKHPRECHLRFFVDILKLWVIVTLSLSNITSRTKAFTISFRTGYPVYLTKSPVQVTLYLVGVKERVTALFLLLNTEA